MSAYDWKCNRCDTSAADSSRVGVEMFAEHHMRVMHPLFVAGRARPQRRNRRASRPASLRLSRSLVRSGVRGTEGSTE